MNIPNPKRIEGRYIQDKVTNIKREDSHYVISYKHYNDKECELNSVDRARMRKILVDYRKICKCDEVGQLIANGIDHKPVYCENDYKKIFKGLDPEQIDMREDVLGGSERLYYFITDNLFNIVCIKKKHLETNKVRR